MENIITILSFLSKKNDLVIYQLYIVYLRCYITNHIIKVKQDFKNRTPLTQNFYNSTNLSIFRNEKNKLTKPLLWLYYCRIANIC